MDDSAPSAPVAAPQVVTSSRRIVVLSAVLAVLVVVVTWVVGYLPWVLDGFRPDPAVVGPGTSSDGLGAHRLPLPLIAGQLVTLVACTVIGAIAATLLPYAFAPLPRPLAAILSALVMVLTVVVLASVARNQLSGAAAGYFAGDARVLDGLLAGVIGIAVVCGVLGMAASLQPGLLPLAVAVLLTQLDDWLIATGARTGWIVEVSTAALLAVAFVVSVRRSSTWAVLWPVALAIGWVQVPFAIALQSVADRLGPGKNVDNQLGDIISAARDLFEATFWSAPRTWWPEVVALAIGAVWLLVRRTRSPRSFA